VQNTDAVVAIGGGRGTFDCVEKAFLSQKPVFVAKAIACKAASAWNSRAAGYKYLVDGDAEPFDDLNVTPDEFFKHVFDIVNRLSDLVYPRRVFIVHGRRRRVVGEGRDFRASDCGASETREARLRARAETGQTWQPML
jgi:hypothetical protein